MIGLVLVTHGRMAEEFLHVLTQITGAQAQVEAICLGAQDQMEDRRGDIMQAIEKANSGAGVLILTDMFGGTPSNLALSLSEKGRVEVLAGVNLPMLIKLATVRKTKPLHEAAELAAEAGRKSIQVASSFLQQAETGTAR